MSAEGSSSTKPRGGTPVAGTSRSTGSTSTAASGSIGSLHTPVSTPAGRLSSLRGGRGGIGMTPVSTRGGTAKMKFAPTVPNKRNRKDAAPSLLEEARAGSEGGQGSSRGRGERGDARGRGRGRGRPVEVIATASGPFSLGPAAFARSRLVAAGSASGAHSSYTGVKAIKVEDDVQLSGEDRDYYGAVDMKFGLDNTDPSVPTGLGYLREDIKNTVIPSVGSMLKNETMDGENKDVGVKTSDGLEGVNVYADGQETKTKVEGPAQELLNQWVEDQLYFFQFPSVMPAFKPKPVAQNPMPSTVSSSPSSSPGPSTSTSMLSSSTNNNNSQNGHNSNSGHDNTGVEYTEDGLLVVKSEPIDTADRPMLIPEDQKKFGSVNTEQSSDARLGGAMDSVQGSTSSNAPVGQRTKSKAATSAAATTTPTTISTTDHVEKEDVTEDQSTLQQEGKIGRLLVYKSGKVKMQVGDIIMDVSSGSDCSFLQDIVVVDSNNKQAFVMGSVRKRLICVPNLKQLLHGLEATDV